MGMIIIKRVLASWERKQQSNSLVEEYGGAKEKKCHL